MKRENLQVSLEILTFRRTRWCPEGFCFSFCMYTVIGSSYLQSSSHVIGHGCHPKLIHTLGISILEINRHRICAAWRNVVLAFCCWKGYCECRCTSGKILYYWWQNFIWGGISLPAEDHSSHHRRKTGKSVEIQQRYIWWFNLF